MNYFETNDRVPMGSVERLLAFAVLREPDRFATMLDRVLVGPDPIALRAGRVWAVTKLQDSLPPSVPTDVAELSTPGRRGAAGVFSSEPDDAVDVLKILFDDPDADVRSKAAQAMRHLEDASPHQVNELVRSFMSSTAFDEHFDSLIDSLEEMTTILPHTTIDACERAVEAAGDDLADIRTARALTGQDLTVVILRLYRQGDPDMRTRCLDVIDSLTELNAHGITEALDAVR